jgi:transcription initiation factor IIE alpha subunit
MMENYVIVSKTARNTSRWSAAKAYPKSGTKRLKVYELIVSRGMNGMTDQEIQNTLHLSGDTVRPSRIKLLRDGLIIDSGETRKNSNDNPCVVWRAIDTGMMF